MRSLGALLAEPHRLSRRLTTASQSASGSLQKGHAWPADAASLPGRRPNWSGSLAWPADAAVPPGPGPWHSVDPIPLFLSSPRLTHHAPRRRRLTRLACRAVLPGPGPRSLRHCVDGGRCSLGRWILSIDCVLSSDPFRAKQSCA